MCIIASQWVYEKAPGDKAVTQAEIYKTKLCVWEGNNSPTLLRERIIFWRPHSKMDINMKKREKISQDGRKIKYSIQARNR